ncbi:hypothetical protein [Aegicerativicinus sediminis]|uniref:hypothetical protein n=1 Tax=Aegicerativicinus sediminis TaxID=2893202 RepID=UPI001E411AF3|nr:hypothetical protein [Aegicerativicinus sediminis]
MIKFFRKIRQKLLPENKFSKYLVYAIGEIVLVVIGILLAVQINSWNQDRKDAKTELDVLKKLNTNIQTDTATFHKGISQIQSSLDKLNIIEDEINNEKLDRFSINIIRPMLDAVNINLETTTWENLKSTGELNLIKNAQLTDSIQNYYIQFSLNSRAWTDAYVEYNRNILAPKFFELDDFSMFAPSDSIDPDIQKKQPFAYGQSIFFRNSLRYRKGALQSLLIVFKKDLSRAKSVLKMLNEEIIIKKAQLRL